MQQTSNIRSQVIDHFEKVAPDYDRFKATRSYYHQHIKELCREFVVKHQAQRILEIGCGTGDVLAFMPCRHKFGLDISRTMVELAAAKHGPSCLFFQGEAEHLPFDAESRFDCIIMPDTLEHVYNIEAVIAELSRIMAFHTRCLLIWANFLWEPMLDILGWLKLKMPEGPHHWHSFAKVSKIIKRNQLDIEDRGWRLLIPERYGSAVDLINQHFYKVPVLKRCGLIHYIVLRKNLR